MVVSLNKKTRRCNDYVICGNFEKICSIKWLVLHLIIFLLKISKKLVTNVSKVTQNC